MKEKEASDLLPFDDVNEKYCVSAFGDIVFGVKIETKEVYTLGSSSDSEKIESVDLLYHDWKKTLSMLPEGTIVQKIVQLRTLPHTRNDSNGCVTKRWNEDMFIKREVMFEDTYLIVSYQYSKKNTKQGSKSIFSRIGSFEGLQFADHYVQQFESFVESLKTSCNSVNVLSGWNILELFCDTWNGGQFGEFLQDVNNDQKYFKVGGNFRSVLTSRKLPSSFVAFTEMNRKIVESDRLGINNTNYREDVSLATSFLFPIGMGLPVDHTLIETIRIEDKDEVEMNLGKEHQRLNFLVGLKSADAIKKRQVIDEVKQYRVDNEYKYASWGVTVILQDESEETLKKLSNLVSDIAQKQLGIVMAVENYGAWKNFYAALPGCGRLNQTLRLGFLEVYSYMTHIESFKKGNSNGIVLVDLFGRPFVFDFWDEKNKYCEARNGMVFAPTGQGKSFLINHILDQCYWNGDVIFLIDVGASYSRITELNNGEYIDSKKLDNLKFNPFMTCYRQDGVYYPELNSNGEKDAEWLNEIATLILYSWKSPNLVAMEHLNTIKGRIVDYFKYVNDNKIKEVNFDGFYHYVLSLRGEDKPWSSYLDFNSFEISMKCFTLDGEYGFLFNAERIVDINNRWITFDLQGILTNKTLATPVLMIVMSMFTRTIKKWKGTNCRIFIDEAIDFLVEGMFADYIGQLYRKIRKEGGQVMIITQSVDFLDVMEDMQRSSIMSNSSVKILLNHSKVPHLYDKIQKYLGLSNSEMNLVRNMSQKGDSTYRIGFIKFGSMPGFLFRHEVSPETFSLYQTNAKDIEKINRLIEVAGIEGAAKSFVELND